MQKVLHRSAAVNPAEWLAPLGLSTRLFFAALSPQAVRAVTGRDFQTYCQWMGKRSFHFIALSAASVAIALTIQCVTEMQRYRAQELSGAVIAIGLLRELGPLIISLAWCARVSALMAEESRAYADLSDDEFARRFVCPRYLAALAMSIPLGGYGLVVGFITGALVAPLLGVASTNDFLLSAKLGIHDRDLWVYFIKLILVNPTIGVFAGCAAGRLSARDWFVPASANAVTATFLTGYIANTMITFAAYIR